MGDRSGYTDDEKGYTPTSEPPQPATCANDVIRDEDDRPNDPAVEPERWLWRPNKRRGNYGLLLIQASFPVLFFIVLPGNDFPQRWRVWGVLFGLALLGLLLFILGFGMNEKANTRRLMFSTMWPPLALCLVVPIASIASAFTPSPVSVSILFIAPL